MSKTLRTAALVVGAVALVATGVGAAAGAGLFGAAVSVSAAATTIATVGTLASVASGVIGLAGSLTAKKPSASVTGSPTQFTADPQGFIPYVMGRTGTAGNIVFRRGYDSADKGENDRQAFVTILSGAGPIKSYQRFEVDRATVTFGAGGAAVGAYAGYMWQGQQNGGGLANNAPGFGAGGTPPGWTTQHKLTGYAATTWTLRFDTKGKLYASGVPVPMWIVEGVVAYDPRYDSTYPGGNGTHRIDDETTWSYSENPFIHALTWVIGRRQNGVRILGIGAPAAGIDIAAFVEGANVADANGWKVGGVVYSGDGKWDTLKRILQAGMGEPMALGARISCFVNAPKVSLATIGTADVVGDASVTATQPRRDRVNTITPRYRLEANNWQLLPGSPITVPAHVTEDGGQRSREQDYLLIQNTDQVATAVRYDIENAREFGPIVLPLKPVWIGFKPGDCVTADLPELGLNGQPILLLSRDLDPSTGVPTFTSRSETAAKHPFALGQTTTPPATPGITGPLLVPVPADGAWAITGTQIVRGETTVPAIVIAGATDSPVADTVVFEYRVVVAGQGGDAGWQGAGEEPPTVTRKVITAIQPGAQYEAAVSYRRRGIVGDRRVLGPVQVGDLALDFDYVTGPTRPDPNATNSADPNSPFGPDGGTVGEIISSVTQTFQTLQRLKDDIEIAFGPVTEQINKRIDDAVKTLEEADDAFRDQIANIEVGDPSGDIATIKDDIAALVREDEAIAGRFQTIGTTLEGYDSQISDIGLTASRADGAVATLRTDVTTSFFGVYSFIGSERTAWTAADTIMTRDISTQGGRIGNLGTDISTINRTLIDQDKAISSIRVSIIAVSAPNLIENGAFTNGTNGWNIYNTNGNWDVLTYPDITFAQHYFNANSGAGFYTDVSGIIASKPYCISFENDNDGGANGHFTIQWYAAGYSRFIGYSSETPEDGTHGWGNRVARALGNAPTDAAIARVQYYPSGGNGIRRIARVMFQQSDTPTGYSDAASLTSLGRAVSTLSSRVDDYQGAIVDATTRTASAFWEKTAQAGDGRVKLSLVAIDNNGQRTGKVAIEGDLEVSGDVLVEGTVTSRKAAFGMTGVDSLYYYQQFTDNSQTDFSAGPSGLGIEISEGSAIDGRINVWCTNLNNQGRVFAKVVRLSDGTAVWGGDNGLPITVGANGNYAPVAIEFSDSVPAGTGQQYDLRLRCEGGANIRSTMRTIKLTEKVRAKWSQIHIVAPASQGPGAGNAGGGQINGDASGSGGVTGTNPSGGNSNYGGLRGRTAEP